MYTKKSFILSDSHQKAELIAEMNKTLPQFRNGYAYDFELSNGRNYLDAVKDQWTAMRVFPDLLSIDPYEQDLTCVFREIDGVTIQKSLLKWQVAKQSVTNKCQKLLFYDMGAF